MNSKKLSLRRETLTEIGPDRLAFLAGGATEGGACSAFYSCTCPESYTCPLTYTCFPPIVISGGC